MTKEFNEHNEVMKKKYEDYLSSDDKLSDKTIYNKIKSLRKYEVFTNFQNLKTFNKAKATNFKETYKKQDISFNTIWRTLKDIKEFFVWLSRQAGYKRNINIDHTKCFNLSQKEDNIANIRRLKETPTLEQIYNVIENMPNDTEKQKRDRAVISFCILTGARIEALMTLKIKSVDEHRKILIQDPSDGVKTKNNKYIITKFFPIHKNIEKICLDWLKYLKENKLFNELDNLFPTMKSETDEHQNFIRDKLSKNPITSTTTIRTIFKNAFELSNMKQYHPHSFRRTIIKLGYSICKTPEHFKAWSQNIGHKSPLTTFTSYGTIDPSRQIDIIEGLNQNTKN